MMDETSEMQPFMNDRDNHMNNGGARRRGIGNNSMTIEVSTFVILIFAFLGRSLPNL